MIVLAPVAGILEAFFTDRLMRERDASPHTVAAYRDTFRLLLGFVQQRLGKAPSALTVADLDAPLMGAFLDHLERHRGNTARTRNARLAAIHSFFRYLALREPAHAGVIQRVLAMPSKRYQRPCRRACASPSSSACAARTSSSAQVLTCAVAEKAARSGVHRSDGTPSRPCAPGCASAAAVQRISCCPAYAVAP